MKFISVTTASQLEKLAGFLKNHSGFLSLDIETSATNPWRDEIVGIGLCWEASGSVYVPINHHYFQPFGGKEALDVLRPVLENAKLIAFNAPFEAEFLELQGKIKPKTILDVALMAYVKADYELLSLKNVAEREIPGIKAQSFREFMQEHDLSPNKDSIADVPLDKVSNYCGRDALANFLLFSRLYPQVKEHKIYKLECATQPVVLWLRRNGVLVDSVYMKHEGEQLKTELEELQRIIETQISEKVGHQISFNIGSSQQLGSVLYDMLKLPCTDLTVKGQRRTGQEILNKLKWKHPIVQNLIAYKQIQKAASTYFTNYIEYVEKDGRIHASYNQAGAPTGRFSCSDPNLQNIPGKQTWAIEKPNGKTQISTDMRNSFVVPEDCWFVEYDYSQIESRIAAGVTKDPILLNVFKEGIDFHTKTASLIFQVPLQSVTREQRRFGKTLNFALAYGMGVKKLYRVLSEEMPIEFDNVRSIHRRYQESYSVMFHEAEMIGKGAERTHSVETVFGRKVPVFAFTRDDEKSMDEGRRMAYNGVIQGSAADLLKRGLVRTYSMIQKKYGLDNAKLIMTIHDSMAFEVNKKVPLQEFIDDCLGVLAMELPEFPKFYAEVEVGERWGMVEKVKNGNNLPKVAENPKKLVLKGTRVFILELPSGEAPRTQSQILNLLTFIKSRPGNNKIIVKIGEREQELLEKTSVTLEDKERIVLMIGGKFYERIVA